MGRRVPQSRADECGGWRADRSESVAEGKERLSQYFYLSLDFKLSQMETTQEEKGQEDGWEQEGDHGVGGRSLTIPPS